MRKIVLAKLSKLWEKMPHQRLGQLICNASKYYNSNSNPFYIENENLIEGIEQLEKSILESRELNDN